MQNWGRGISYDFLCKQGNLRCFQHHHALKNGFIIDWIIRFDELLRVDDEKEKRTPLSELAAAAKAAPPAEEPPCPSQLSGVGWGGVVGRESPSSWGNG